jgi:MYXO-CTERM domain-containing protein
VIGSGAVSTESAVVVLAREKNLIACRAMKAAKASFLALLGLGSSLCVANPAHAFPGFLASKTGAEITVSSTQMVVMKKGNTTAVSVMSDYQGGLEPFAMVLVVPGDVTADRVTTLKREFVDRIDAISAPRFHEYWEQDPCDPGPVEQEWQRSMKADSSSAFLGGGDMPQASQKVAKELSLDVQAQKKEGEYSFTLLAKDDKIGAWLKSKGYAVPAGAEQALAPYLAAGMRLLVAQVDTNRIELVGGDRAQLSPIRFWTDQPYDTIPDRVGLLNASGKQELLLYVLDPEQRYESKNYENVFPPTNITVDFAVKERMGEFYVSLADIIAQKKPNAFLDEYAWSSDGCGQPCATEPLMISELLSLGGDVFEQAVSKEDKNPKPPALSKEEQAAFKDSLKDLKPKERKAKEKQAKEDRLTVAARQALVARHKYVLSRMHYRYDDKSLPSDPKIGPASGAVEGGVAQPKGQKGDAASDVKAADQNKYQVRYNNFHPWVPVIQCQNPERYRWGKSPPDYRGLRKTWIAEDLTRKSRTQIKAASMIQSPIPSLGITGIAPAPAASAAIADAGADAGADGAAKSSGKCGCSVPGAPSEHGLLAMLGGLFGLAVAGRRRRR